MTFLRWSSVVVAIAVAVVQGVAPAEAQGNICLDLEARLIEIERGAADPAGADNRRQYNASVAQQRNEIDRATAEARRAGCMGGFLIFQRRAEAKCPKLMATIDQMRANLSRLMQARGQFGDDRFTLARERSEILRSLSMNRCGPSYAAGGMQQPQEPVGLLEAIFGQPRFRTWGEDNFGSGAGFGTYRTLCVRTCDGYYFPISFSTVPGKFNDDALGCQQMCPGTEAILYTHRNPGEDASQMVSLAGEPYTALPTAFLYRQKYDRTCTCRSATALAAATDPAFTDFSPIGSLDSFDIESGLMATFAAPMPRLRPAPGEDPETAANRAGDFIPRPVAPRNDAQLAGISADGQRKIRIVGPEYFYAP